MGKTKEQRWLEERLEERQARTQDAEMEEMEAEKDLDHFKDTGRLTRRARARFRREHG